MDPRQEWHLMMTRRQFFGRAAAGIGAAALGSLLAPRAFADDRSPNALGAPHFAPRAKRVIYLFQSGAPSQLDLFDHKPLMNDQYDEDLPESISMGQRLTTMTSGQKRFPVAPSIFKFKQHGDGGAWISNLLPYTAQIADELCFIKSMHTEAINHDPAMTFFQTGHQIAGRPSMGSWLSYGLGSENANLPAFVVLTSRGSGRPNGQPLAARLWGSGFLPTTHQGVRFRGRGDPVLYVNDPPGVDTATRRGMLDGLAELNQMKHDEFGDPEILTRIAQYEMAFRMQTSVPELTNISGEPESILNMYGPDVKKPGSYAWNCLMARRLSERGVRFVQLFHMGWDQHTQLPKQLPGQCRDTDQPSAALVMDLKQRGLLDETLIVWGGEFGRTIYCQGQLTKTNYGRDHHPRCFTIWLAGGGVKRGISYGKTDDHSYNIVENPVHVHDLHTTMLHLLGMNHENLTFRYQGRDFRLTDVHGQLVKDIVA